MKVRKDFGKTKERIFYEFGPFRVDARERVLRRGEELVRLTPKVFDILEVLIQNSGCVLTKDELMKRVWPDTMVEESNLARNVSTLRKALNERPDQCHYIETIPWRGYRFAAAVTKSHDASRVIDSIAVLPFINESSDSSAEYLSDGITDGLINKLSLLRNLKVMSRNSVFHCQARNGGTLPDAETVGRELGVLCVLTGRIRVAGEIVLVSVELIDATDNRQLWGAQYNRQFSDMATLQETISRQIANRLQLNMTGKDRERLSQPHTNNTEAYQLHLKGRYFWNKLTVEGVRKAIDMFEQAIEKDPGYALAYTGLLDCHIYCNNPVEARKALAKALELDPDLGEAHASSGFFKFIYDWDFSGCEKELKQAIELSPNYPQAHHWYAIYLAHAGRHGEAIDEAKRAQELDPLSTLMNQTLGNTLMLARDYDGAIDALQKTLELDSHFAAAHSVLGYVYTFKGMYAEALQQLARVAALAGGNPAIDASIKILTALVYARCGQATEALQLVERVSRLPEASPYSIAGVYAALGEADQAFAFLNRAYQARSFQLVSLNVDPGLDGIRTDPRFDDLLRRIGLPA